MIFYPLLLFANLAFYLLLFADLPCGAAAGASLEFARILVIASEQNRGSNLGILEFPSLLTAATAKSKVQHKSRIPKPVSLRGSKATEAISIKILSKIPSLRGIILEFGYLCIWWGLNSRIWLFGVLNSRISKKVIIENH